MRAAVVAVVAACSAPPQPPPVIGNAPSLNPSGPAPRVARGGMYGLTTSGLPAVAADGSRIVAAYRESDGARGMPNLTIVMKDRGDTDVERHVVLSIAEADTMLDDAEGRNPPLDERVARANHWLHDRHAVLKLVALPLLDPEATKVPADRTKATRDGVTVVWQTSHLRITDGADVLVDRQTPTSWLPEHATVGTNACRRCAYLGAAAVDRTRELAVVTISYTADGEFCVEPPDQHHVVTW